MLRATEDGRMITTDAKKINKIIRLDLSKEREKEVFVVPDTTEITFNIVDKPIYIYLDNPDEDNRMTIVRPCSICTETGRFYISNMVLDGEIEIWLWR